MKVGDGAVQSGAWAEEPQGSSQGRICRLCLHGPRGMSLNLSQPERPLRGHHVCEAHSGAPAATYQGCYKLQPLYC